MFWHTLAFTFAQAFVSALVALALGFIGAMGIVASPRKSFIKVIAILPNTLPIVFVIFTFMKYAPSARGFFGVVLIHSLLNAGLVAIAVYQIFESKIGSLAETAWILGASKFKFLKRVVVPYLKNDLARIFFFVFALCFSSFAIPLMLGATTIEVLIYEKIRISADWSRAFGIALFEVVFIYAISMFVGRQVSIRATHTSKSPLLKSTFGILLLFTPTFFILLSLASSAFGARPEGILNLSLGSYFIAVGSGALTYVLLMLTARLRPPRRILLGVATPSAVIVGFVLIYLFRETGMATFYKLIIGLTIMHFPVLYRLSWDSQVYSLDKQIETARTLGATSKLVFSKIASPQILRSAFQLSGLAALWSFSDFTLASVVAEKNLSLAQLFAHLTETYRWESAESLILPMIIGSISCYLLFSGVGYVASRIALR